MLILLLFAGILFVHQLGANHAPRVLIIIQVIHFVHRMSTFWRDHACSSILIFWVSVTVALSDTSLMFSSFPFFTVSLIISILRSLYLLFLSIIIIIVIHWFQ